MNYWRNDVKVYVYDIEEFSQFNFKLFDKEGVSTSETEVLKFNALDSVQDDRITNVRNLILGKEMSGIPNVTPFGSVKFGRRFFATSQYVLEPWIHCRLRHPNRVASLEEADIAFLPFYSYLLKRSGSDPLKSLISYSNIILPRIHERNIPHIIACSDVGHSNKEALREMFKLSSTNFYFLCYKEDMKGYYLPKVQSHSRIITVPYQNYIHKIPGTVQIHSWKPMKRRELFSCHVGTSITGWPLAYMSNHIPKQYFVSKQLNFGGWKSTGDMTIIREIIEF